METLIIKGNFFDCAADGALNIRQNAYCVVEDGVSQGVYETLPQRYAGAEITDYGDVIIMPGMVDLHTHAPQYAFRGTGMQMELLDWLETYTFPEESRYREMAYAKEAYSLFVSDLQRSTTTRAVIFGTIHRPATLFLMEELEKTGLITYVGKVNMDRNAPDYYVETTEESLAQTGRFLEQAAAFSRTRAILTPRFIPSCSDALMQGLSAIQKKTGLGLQSHLSENRNEIAWVKELCPQADSYADAYDRFGLFGGSCQTVMAHCVSCEEEEIGRIKERGVFVAHCPNSNMNLSSGIAPVRKYLARGIRVGLGTDLAAGHSLSVQDEMVSAVQASKMYARYVAPEQPLTMTEAFYMATRGGGAFFGRVGSFDAGFEFDALVIDDKAARTAREFDAEARFLRSLYLHRECTLAAKYVRGKKIAIGR